MADEMLSGPPEIVELRARFFEEFKENISNNLYYADDLEEIEKSNAYVQRFLLARFGDMQQALQMMADALKWRKEFGILEICEETLPKWMFEVGGLYYHNRDVEGRKILHFLMRLHKKDSEQLPQMKKFIAYWLEKGFKENSSSQITVLFDMTETGINHMDMDLIRFLIVCFMNYYPNFLANMIVFEMPWILNAAWKIIKSWLHQEAVKRIKFVNRSDLINYIAVDQLAENMGGTDTFKYIYEPEANTSYAYVSQSESEDSLSLSNNNNVKKKVHFSESMPLDGKPKTLNHKKRKITEERVSFEGRHLKICPAFVIQFSEKEKEDSLILTNITKYYVAFKIKTTAPQKYKVWPSSGIAKPGSILEVQIHLTSGDYTNLHEDKFLVMSTQLENNSISTSELKQLWRNISSSQITEHRLTCTMANMSPLSPLSPSLPFRPPLTTVNTNFELAEMKTMLLEMTNEIKTLKQSNQHLLQVVAKLQNYLFIAALLILIIVLGQILIIKWDNASSPHKFVVNPWCAPLRLSAS